MRPRIVAGAVWIIALMLPAYAQSQSHPSNSPSQPRPVAGQFQPDPAWFNSKGGPIDEFHCEPTTVGKHPIVMLIHGCAPQGFGDDEFKQMCVSLAEHGYFAMFVEYYSRTGQPNCREYTMDGSFNPGSTHTMPEDIWLREIGSAGAFSGERSQSGRHSVRRGRLLARRHGGAG